MASLSDEIQQKSFRSEHNKLVLNVMYTAAWLNAMHIHLFRQHGLTPEQFNVLRILRGRQPDSASVNLIKERMIDKMSNVSRLIDKLLAKKLVTRKTCITDRRQMDIGITSRGLELLAELDKQLPELEEKLRGISEVEASQVNTLLDKWRG